jgi:hypothetical protein
MDASKITELRQKQNTVYLHRSNTVDSSTMTWRNQIQSSKYIKGVATCTGLQNTDVPTEAVCPNGDGTFSFGGGGKQMTLTTGSSQQYPSVYRGAAGSASAVYSSDKILLQKAGRAYCAELITDQDAYTIIPNNVTVNTNGPTSANPNPSINNQDTNPYLPPFDTYHQFKNPQAPMIDQNQKHYVQYCDGCVVEPIVTRYGWPLWMVGIPDSRMELSSRIISNSVTYNGDSVFVTGTFLGTINVYDGTPTPPAMGPPTIVMTSESINLDAFLIKYDQSGKIQWFTTMKTVAGTQTTGYSIAVDATGIYVSGYTDGTINLYHAISRESYTVYGPIISSLSTVSSALFVLKYTLSGYLQWVTLVDHVESQTLPPPYEGEPSPRNDPQISPMQMSQLCVDGKHVYVCNYFNTTATVYNSNGVLPLTMDNSIPLASMSYSTQAFLVQYNAETGATSWATQLLGDDITFNGTTRTGGLVCDANNVYMSGFFNTAAVCYDAVTPGSPTLGAIRYKISNGSDNGMFIMSYSKTGIVQWINQGNILGTSFIPTGIQLTMDASGVYVVFPFSDVISLNNNPGGGSFVQLINPGVNTYNLGIVKYTLAGSIVWVNKILDVDRIDTNGFSLSSDGSALYVTGGFGQNTIRLYNALAINPTIQAATLSTAGGDTSTNAFLIKYNLLGALQWSTIIGRINNYAYGYRVLSNTNNIYLTGAALGAVDLYHSNGLAQPTKIAISLVPNAGTYYYSYVIKYDHNGQVVLV